MLVSDILGPGFCPMDAKSHLSWITRDRQDTHSLITGVIVPQKEHFFFLFNSSSNHSTPVGRYLHLGYEGFRALKEGYVQVADVSLCSNDSF